ncbi:hypothetical protein GQ55_8G041400 [Panicum hallii var. hallii]|uniref:Uncharacterized protein n=1 Tax=Panicum hallii var. hallii TaxID=1504633 RepID=A0A2T7CKJ4_9POAL|nr:hypothetical protein GQ55_8G041300 [Panicum hallii var. hallii]PUZ43867.1 hypothetical protein GQ55_8G041300 [Panicum hallii var. hallii]PUZ43868.1 hypothetical protein GQ55_8G041400 [Panicum hallii var. hallii]
MSQRQGEESGCSSRVSTPLSAHDESRPKASCPPPPPPSSRRPSRLKPCKGAIRYPYHMPVGRSSATIQTVEASLLGITGKARLAGLDDVSAPLVVTIGPYHRGAYGPAWSRLRLMDEAKDAALEEFGRVSNQPREALQEKILSVAASARECYGGHISVDEGDRNFAEMLLLDGCFLLQFMMSMCPDDPKAPAEPDPLMSRAEVHTCIDAIARDVMLFENQIPWLVLEALMELRPGVPVDRFLTLMASAFQAGNDDSTDPKAQHDHDDHHHNKPPHLLGLFHRRQIGTARTQSLLVPKLSSLSTTAVELAEMGVKLTAGKTKKFGDMSMANRQWRGLGLFGELSLAPVVLNDLTACWLINMAAYEACVGATQADNFAVSSYISVVALLVNREEDVQELRGKGIINSAMSDMGTLEFFKWAAPHLRVGHRYYEVFRGLQEYRQRWAWMAVHRFLYKNYKTIGAVLSIIGVLAGLFKTILSLKQ